MSIINVDSISDAAGTGSPSFPNGISGNGSALTSLTSANLTGALPAIDGSALTSLTSGNLTGALPAISGAALTGIAAGGFQFISSIDITNDVQAVFTGFDAAKYDSYKFVYSNVIPATDNTALDMQFSEDGGSTWATGASDYTYLRVGYVGDPAWVYNTTTTTKIRLNNYGIGSAAGEDGISGYMDIHGPHLAKRTMITSAHVGIGANVGKAIGGLSWGRRNSAVATNAVRFFFAAGNLESGTITMYGMVNS